MKNIVGKLSSLPTALRLIKLLAMLTSCVLLLTACETTQTTATGDACLGWKKIRFSAKSDSGETIAQVRRHDAFGHKRGCW